MFLLLKSLFLLLLCTTVSAETYHYVSIKNDVKQNVGRLIIPEIYKKLNHQVSISPMPGKRAQLMASMGKKDGEIMRIWNYGNENPSMHRVPTSYYYVETMAFIKKDSGIHIKTKDDLKKYKLIKVSGIKHTNNITQGMPRVRDVNNSEKMMKMLQLGRADIALTNGIGGKLVLKKLGYSNIVPIKSPLATLKVYHYIHTNKKHLVEKVDKVIKDMIASGEMARVINNAEKIVLDQ